MTDSTTLANLPAHARDFAQRQRKVIESMSPDLQLVYHAIVDRTNRQAELSFRHYHWIGESLIKVQDASKYGSGAVEKIAEASGYDLAVLYKARAFAAAYTDAELEELIKLRTLSDDKRNSGLLSWTHVVQLLSVEDKKTRRVLQERVAREGLTVQALADLIQDHFGGKRRGGGRPLARPVSASAGLRQLQSVSGQWLKRQQQVWNGESHSLFEDLAELPPEQYTPETVEALEAVIDTQTSMRDACRKNIEDAQTLLKTIRQRLKSAPPVQQPGPVAAAGKPARRLSAAAAAASKAAKQVKAAKPARKK